tara:strand:+ start:1178 stop:1768 length:591 start_codon:yes stop_codon:yes gene_type:complete
MAMQQAKSLNPALREIESIFNPVDDPIVNQESEENDLEQLREGIFIQRNYNIVPHYREYLQQKSQIISCVQRTKNQRVLKKREQIAEQKKAYAQFYLNRWAIYRKLENERLDKEMAQLRTQKLAQFWICKALAHRFLKQASENFEATKVIIYREAFKKILIKKIQAKLKYHLFYRLYADCPNNHFHKEDLTYFCPE